MILLANKFKRRVDPPPLEAISVINGGGSTLRLNLFANKIILHSTIIIATTLMITAIVMTYLVTPSLSSSYAIDSDGERDNNWRQMLQNTTILIFSYCVVAQFDVDIEAVQSRRIKWLLIIVECNNCAVYLCSS